MMDMQYFEPIILSLSSMKYREFRSNLCLNIVLDPGDTSLEHLI